ncbi:hypothetical protein NSP_41680 [Nodularia spumigena CCY9414]|nr:hypothetical protein NSP_41680 [Nodularia spumigena CCY9414]
MRTDADKLQSLFYYPIFLPSTSSVGRIHNTSTAVEPS